MRPPDLTAPARYGAWARRLSSKMERAAAEKLEDDIRERVAFIERITESPIEAELLGAFNESAIDLPKNGRRKIIIVVAHGRSCLSGLEEWLPISSVGDDRDKQWIAISPQMEIGNYRVDFLLTEISPSSGPMVFRHLAVECDGHEFHERTKDQARRDKARDRALLRMGIPTIRFSGSEIYTDPLRCAAEALATACVVRPAHFDDEAAE